MGVTAGIAATVVGLLVAGVAIGWLVRGPQNVQAVQEAPESDTDDRAEVPAGTRVVIGVACAGVLLIGLVPGFLLDIASDAVPVLVGG